MALKEKNRFLTLWSENKYFREIMIILGINFLMFFLIFVIKLFDWAGALFPDVYQVSPWDLILFLLVIITSVLIFSFRRWKEYKEVLSQKLRLEYRFQKSSAQLQAVFDGIPDIIFQVDDSMRVTWANKATLDLNPDAIGQKAHVALSYTEGTFIDSYCKWSMDIGRIEKGLKYAATILGSDSESYWECIAVPLKDKKNIVFGALAIARDVSHRMRIEHTWNLLASIVESTDDAIFGISIDGTILNWNNGAERTYGYSTDESIGKNVRRLLPIDDRVDFSLKIENVMRKKTVQRFDSYRIKSDGSLIQVNVTLCPFLDATGRKVGVSTIERDITESRKARKALIESEERYRSFVQNFKGIAFKMLSDFTPIFYHGAVKEITGYDDKDFTEGRVKWEDLIYMDDRDLRSFFPHKDKEGNVSDIEIEYRIVRKDNKLIWVQEHAQNIYDSTGELVFIQGTVYDINIRKNAEKELTHSREQLRNLAIHLDNIREEERKQIAFEIHDELGYALTAMKLDLGWIKQKVDTKEVKMRERTDEMTTLIDSTIKKVRSISTQLRPSILDHFGLLAAMEWQAKEFQKRTAIRCNFNAENIEIKFDDRFGIAVFRILQEALTNITRHANASRVDIDLMINEGNLNLTVNDNGVGMKYDPMEKRKSMGLISMRERANFMGGNLNINSEIGEGTEIQLVVPIKQQESLND